MGWSGWGSIWPVVVRVWRSKGGDEEWGKHSKCLEEEQERGERESSGARGSQSFLDPPSSFFLSTNPKQLQPTDYYYSNSRLLILHRILNMIMGQFTHPLIILRFDSIHCTFSTKVRYTSRSEINNRVNT